MTADRSHDDQAPGEADDVVRLQRAGDAVYRRLVEGVLDYAIFLLTPAGRVATWNAGAQRIKGYEADEVIGRHFSVFYTPPDIARAWPAEELKLAREQGHLEDEGWRVRKDGSTFWANVVITAILNPDGELLGYAKVTRDLTARREQEAERLRMAELVDESRRMTEFIAMLSHEIRNPLAPIMNVLAIMARETLTPRGEWCLSVADKQVRQIHRLVEDLLDVSRVTTGKVRLDMQPLELGVVVEEAVEGMRPAADARGHLLHASLSGEPMRLSGDRTRLIQLVSNLLNNSIKFTPAGGRIALSLHREEEDAVLTVTDNGIGMTEDTLSHAFEPFSQGEEHARGHGALGAQGVPGVSSGLGVGLALVRSIAELHGGTVGASSAGTGQGSVVTVRLPLRDPPLNGRP
ncbi:PAS domain-containing sensor histidine kinase [Mitsuaria sp. 7]|uniref:PAS domain-containing sensor histidine kinase n=1 Tax=Mitsuaria sp. 7 TaxID=1658665 RepID=UPI00082D67A6|nr:PAS domain-containing sensor histidine kinase [Mitsuaria sp. 7]